MAATYRDSIAVVGSGSTITVNPASPALTYSSGDVLVLFVWGYTSLGAPSGSDLTWTERLSDTQAGPFGNTDIHKVWTAVADASITSFTIANGAADQYGFVLVSVQDADTTTPVDAAAIDSNIFDNVAQPTSPSVSPTGTDSLLLCGAGVWPPDGATSTFTPPTGMTEREDFESWDSYSVATLALSASGATGAKAFTESPSLLTGAWIASSIAIKSAAGGGATVSPAVIACTTALPAATAIGSPVLFVGTSTAWAAGSTSIAPAMASGWAAGDLLTTVIHCKPTLTVTAPTLNTPDGWTLRQEPTQLGSELQGTDAGAVWQAVYERIAVGGDTAPTYTVTNGNVSLGLMLAWRKPASRTWAACTTTSGNDASSGTGFSVTGAADLSLAAGDVIAVLSGPAGNATQSSGAVTATGATFATIAETVEGDTNTGTDLAASVWHAVVTGGPSSAAPGFTATLSASRTGGATFIRLRSTTGDATASPAVLASVAALPASVLSAGSAVAPAAFAAVAALPQSSPASATDATATPAVLPAVAALPAPAPAAASSTTPAVVAATAALPAATPSAAATKAATVIPAVAALPAATPTSATVAAPAVIAAVVDVKAFVVEQDWTADPAVIPATVALPAATTNTGSGATPTPAAIASVAALPAASPSAASTIPATVIPVVAAMPAATTTQSATKAASVIPATTALPAATTSAGSTASPAAIPLVVVLPSVTISAGATPTPTVIPVVAALPAATPATTGSANAQPATIAASAALAAVTLSTGSTVTPAVILTTTALPAATAAIGTVVAPLTFSVTVALPAAATDTASGTTATPSVIAISTGVNTPTISAASVAAPATLAVVVSLPGALVVTLGNATWTTFDDTGGASSVDDGRAGATSIDEGAAGVSVWEGS